MGRWVVQPECLPGLEAPPSRVTQRIAWGLKLGPVLWQLPGTRLSAGGVRFRVQASLPAPDGCGDVFPRTIYGAYMFFRNPGAAFPLGD